MTSEKLRRDWAPEPEIIEDLDSVPLMKRSRVINTALKEYFDKQKNSDFNSEVLKHLLEIKTLLKELVKARK